MADHSKPTTTSTYVNFVSELDGRLDDLALGLDPALVTVTNPPNGAIRWSSAINRWQKWDGSAWGELTATYALTQLATTGNVRIGAGSVSANVNLNVNKQLTGGTQVFGVNSEGQIQTDATIAAYMMRSAPSVASGATVPTLIHFATAQGTFTGTVEQQFGFTASSGLLGGTVNNFGFWSGLPADGTKNWAFYGAGSAPSYFGGNLTLNAGTANGVAYLNGSKVLTTGSALTFDGTNLGVGNALGATFESANDAGRLVIGNGSGNEGLTVFSGSTGLGIVDFADASSGVATYAGFLQYSHSSDAMLFGTGSAERMRLTSTGLGIGTSSPQARLDLSGSVNITGDSGLNGTWTGLATRYIAGNNSAYLQSVAMSSGTVTGGRELSFDASALAFRTISGASFTERMRLDSSGNLGLGVTPSAWSSFHRAIDVGASVSFANIFGGSAGVAYNGYQTDNNGTWRYRISSVAAGLYSVDSSHKWFTAPSGTAGAAISFTQAMTLEASGRWLLGTTTGVGNDFASIRFNSGGSFPQGLNMVDANASANGTVFQVFRRSDDTYLGNVRRNSTDNALYVGGNSYLALGAGDTERARINSSGNFGLGVTPSAWNLGKVVEVGNVGNALWAPGGNQIVVSQGAYWNSGWKYSGSSAGAVTYYDQFQGAHRWYTAPSGTAGAAISFTQAMTLDSSGNLLVGTTSALNGIATNGSGLALGPGSNGALVSANSSNSNLYIGKVSGYTNGVYIDFYVNGSRVGLISTNGTSTTYSTSSDYRLKENIQPMTGALAKVALLKPCTYKWKADGSEGEGFIAHELATVCPQAVTGEKDAVDENGNPKYQGIDTSFLVATLTAAIQELTARVKALESSALQ